MRKAVIGVTPLYDSERESIWMLPGYMNALEEAGAVPVILPLSADRDTSLAAARLCDGILFTGGQDVSPSLYGEAVSNKCGEVCKMRDEEEKILLEYALGEDIPTLGICRGIQFINAFLGGTLWQDIDTCIPSAVEHHMNAPYDRSVHTVSIAENSPLYALLGKGEIGVNSYHHQAVRKVADCLCVSAVAEDGIVEGIYMPGKRFVQAVQWHPEFFYKKDENSRRIFGAFVSAAEQNC